MKLIRPITIATAILAVFVMSHIPAAARNKVVSKAYMFGFAASFNDSIVYLTDIQEVDSVWFTQKKKMLMGRSNYSYQLRDYFADKMNMPKRTCVVMAGMKRKDVEKKYEKMKKMYTSTKGNKQYEVRYLPGSDFTFKAVNMSDSSDEQADKKKEKKEKKDKKKDNKRPPRNGKMGPPPGGKRPQ